MGDDPVADRLGQVQAAPVALERVDDPQRLLMVAEGGAEALAQAAVQGVLADVAEGWVAEVVAEPDRLDEILVEAQRAGHGPRDLGDLERVGQPRAVVIAAGRDEHLGLGLEPPEGLAVHDPVAIALKRRAQPAVGLGDGAPGRVGGHGERREVGRLVLAHALREAVSHGAAGVLDGGAGRCVVHAPILTARGVSEGQAASSGRRRT